MKKKLTLRMDQDAIEAAKEYADKRGTSVSKLVEQFFEAIGGGGEVDEVETLPLVESLAGIAAGADVTEDDYYRHLEEKHR